MALPIMWMFLTILNVSIEIGHREKQFIEFIDRYNKSYSIGSHEYWSRFQIFMDALKKIEDLNSFRKHPDSAYFGVTPFADMTLDEFKNQVIKSDSRRLRKRQLRLRQHRHHHPRFTSRLSPGLPGSLDWREKGIIGEVVDQGKCGSCWAHTVVDTLSSMKAMETGKYVKLSAQQLLDCSTLNYGCEGGDLCQALAWMVSENVHVVTEAEYPLRDDSGTCRKLRPSIGVQIQANYTCHETRDREETMVELLAEHGPLMAAADASFWQYYVNGTIHENCGSEPNHAVQIVGYNLTAGIPYYIVRNTWGKNFGIDGYLQIALGNNTCAIADEVAAVWLK